jgi:DNA gyrase/topoisomerase IV subunit A
MEVGATARATSGVKGITLNKNDAVSVALPIHDTQDQLAIFLSSGCGKKLKLTDLPLQKRAGKGVAISKFSTDNDCVVAASLVSDEDNVLIVGNLTSVCISAADIPSLGRATTGSQMIKGNKIQSVSKI